VLSGGQLLTYLAWVLALASCSGSSTDDGSGGAGPSSSSSSAGGAGGGGSIDYCNSCAAPAVVGTLANLQLGEASGLVASRVHPDVMYLHNDSGDSARFFAIDSSGADRGSYLLEGVVAQDFEDIAAGPCASGACLYLADIGDNDELRTAYVVHRVSEPAMLAPGQTSVTSEPLTFQYPDGSHNAETLLALPDSGQLFVVTKTSAGPSSIYAFPLPVLIGMPMTLTKIGEVTPPEGAFEITGGDVHPAGSAVLLRSYTNVLLYPLAADLAAALASPPCLLPTPDEPQGESIAWAMDGSSYFTVSEGVQSPLYRIGCGP
jgi:hypothetical protein